MAARKKATPAAKKTTTAADVQAPAAPKAAESASSSTAIEPVATKAGVPTYRTDLGESLPPQKPAGVE